MRRRHSARRILPLTFVHDFIATIVFGTGTDAFTICTSISHLNGTIYAKNSIVHMVDGRACAKECIRVHVLTQSGNITTGVVHCR